MGAVSLKDVKTSYTLAWRWMRYSAFLLVPLVWVHAIIQALVVGGQNLSLSYVGSRWAHWGWRAYDIFLLAFALSHGVNGLRQVICDYLQTDAQRRVLNRAAFWFWLTLALIGAAAVIGGVQ